MRVPLHWLRELVDIDVPTEELAERLSHTGSAVDAIDRFADGVSGIVAGKVLDVADLEGSDKLCISHIDVGDASPLQILAGAKNFSAGDIVPVARVGARVTTLDVPIGARKMMGTESQGMLCSAKELGVADEHEGILILGADTEVGADVVSLLGLDDDVLEFEIYPNRPDQMSVLGIAREVAILYGATLRRPDVTVVEDGTAEASTLTSVTVSDPAGCPRYLARVIEDVTFGVSPPIVRARLTACGVRPLGNLIDATNYVLLLCGQPLHAFDMDLLAEERIVVRTATAGERMETLDGVERALDPEDLVIADASRAQALAGIMGGGTSEVSASTRRVLLESAYFDPVRVSRTSRRHHLRSEASARFERGADPEIVADAASLCAELIRRWSGGKVARGAVDVGAAPERRTLVLRPERVETILGDAVSGDEISRILSGIGCAVDVRDGSVGAVVPSWRPDLEREIDLIEEVARLHGYDRFEPIRATGPRGGRSVSQVLRERIRDAFLGAGLSEATLPTFCAAGDIAAIGYDGPLVRVNNPMTEDQGQLRPSLFPGLLRAAQRNIAHGVASVGLFEFGKIFRGWPSGAELPDESEHVAFVLAGDIGAHWSSSARPPDAYDALGLLDLVLGELGIAGRVLSTEELAPLFHPGRSANVLLDGAMAGRFGELRPSVARAFDLEPPVVVGGLALDAVFASAPSAHTVDALPTQPPVLRDLSLWLRADTAAGDVIATIAAAGGELLESVDVLDEYRPDGDERRSVTFGLTFRAPDRTLRAEEADAARSAIVDAVTREHGAEAR